MSLGIRSLLGLRTRVMGGLSLRSASSFSTTNIIVSTPFPRVFHVKLNRPDRRNAFTVSIEVKQVFDTLSKEPECRVIVLSGEGRSFTTGLDLKESAGTLVSIINDESMDVARRARKMRNAILSCQEGFTAIEKCTKPVIAAIHSHCIGAGVDLVTASDIRYASQDTVFSIREVEVGLAADVGTLNRIQKLVGNDSLTRELAFTARDIHADEAKDYGLVSRVFRTSEECVEGALRTAKRIAELSPVAVQGTKVVLNYARDHTIADSLNFVVTWNQSQLLSEDLIKSVTAAMSKEKPQFDNVE